MDVKVNDKSIMEYQDIAGSNVATTGGELRFPMTASIQDIRGICGDITVKIADLDGTHEVTIAGPTAGYLRLSKLIVQASQKLLISSTVAGWVEVVVLRGDVDAG